MGTPNQTDERELAGALGIRVAPDSIGSLNSSKAPVKAGGKQGMKEPHMGRSSEWGMVRGTQ